MSPASLPFCKGQSHPCHRQVREKKGARGREEGAAGREDCSRYPAPGRGGAVQRRLQMGADRICSSALSFLLFPPPPQPPGKLRHHQLALPSAAAPFCGGLHQHPPSAQCCVTRRRHHVCLLPTYWSDIVTGLSTMSGSADTDTASRLNSAIPFPHCPVDSRGPIQLGSKTASRLAWAGWSAIHPHQ